MSLNYDLRDIKDRDESDAGWIVTKTLIFATLHTKQPTITEKNWQEFYLRVRASEKVIGALMVNGDGSDRKVTADEVKAHIGLKTNAYPEGTRNQFLDNLKRILKEDMQSESYRLERQAEREAAAA